MERRWIYIVITLLTVVMTLSSCTDEQEEARRKVSMALMPLGRPNVEIETRALPTGYYPYVDIFPAEQMPQSSIGIYLVQEPAGTSPIVVNLSHPDLSSFTYKTINSRGAWYSNVSIEENATYRVYGFHPASGIADDSSLEYTHTTTPVDSEDAVLTLPTFSTVSSSDVCVVVGVKKATVTNNVPVSMEDSGIELGNFTYTTGEDDNFMYLLMDHLFSCVNFSFTVDPVYDALRDIRLRKLEIESPSTAEVSVQVTLQSNSAGTDPIQDIQYTLSTPSGSSVPNPVAVIYDKEVSDASILPSSSSGSALSIPGYFMPPTTISSPVEYYFLIATYDVLDNAGKVVREGCVARNKIVLPTSLARGTVHTVNAVVSPTYLYQLSDNDLNNPTLTFLP